MLFGVPARSGGAHVNHNSNACLEVTMAETKANRSDAAKESGQALAHRDREQGSLERRQQTAGWRSTPFEFLNRMTEEMDRTFDEVFRDFGMPRRSWLSRSRSRSAAGEGLWAPRLEAFQKGDQFVVRADLPGMKKDDVQVEVSEGAITIHG